MTERARHSSVGDTVRRPQRHRDDRHQRILFFTIAETAEMLRVCTRTVRRWIDCGDLVAHRFGNAVRIAEPDLCAFLAVRRDVS